MQILKSCSDAKTCDESTCESCDTPRYEFVLACEHYQPISAVTKYELEVQTFCKSHWPEHIPPIRTLLISCAHTWSANKLERLCSPSAAIFLSSSFGLSGLQSFHYALGILTWTLNSLIEIRIANSSTSIIARYSMFSHYSLPENSRLWQSTQGHAQ